MTVLVRRLLPLVALGITMAIIVRNLRAPGVDGDTWFHLRLGAEFRRRWSISEPGHLSPFDTADWVPTQWLSQLGMEAAHRAWGPGALLWFTGVLAIVLLVIVYLASRQVASPLPSSLATVACFVAVAPGLSPRPQVLSYVLVAVATAAWLATVRDGRPRWWLVPMTWLWATLHGMWPTAILMGVAVVLGLAVGRRSIDAAVVRLGAVTALSALVVVLTPVGFGVYSSLAAVGGRARYFDEWASPNFQSPESLVVAAMLAVVVLVGLTRERMHPAHVAWAGLAAAWTLYSARTGPVAAIMIAPLVAAAAQPFLPTTSRATWPERGALAAMALTSLLALAFVAPERAETEVVPAWLDERLGALSPSTRILNDWDIGPWFLWRHPDLHLVSHGYGDVFTDAELERNASIMHVQAGWREEVSVLDVDYALVRPDTPLAYALATDGWDVIEADDRFMLLEPPR